MSAPEPAAPADAGAAPPKRPAPLTDDQVIREYATLIRRNRAIDREKNENNARLEALKQRALDIFEARGQRSMGLVGLGNLHLIRVVRAKVRRDDYTRDATASERERAKEALRAGGWHDLLKETFNLNSVTGRITEARKQNEHLPPEIEDGIYVDESFDIGLNEE